MIILVLFQSRISNTLLQTKFVRYKQLASTIFGVYYIYLQEIIQHYWRIRGGGIVVPWVPEVEVVDIVTPGVDSFVVNIS